MAEYSAAEIRPGEENAPWWHRRALDFLEHQGERYEAIQRRRIERREQRERRLEERRAARALATTSTKEGGFFEGAGTLGKGMAGLAFLGLLTGNEKAHRWMKAKSRKYWGQVFGSLKGLRQVNVTV